MERALLSTGRGGSPLQYIFVTIVISSLVHISASLRCCWGCGVNGETSTFCRYRLTYWPLALRELSGPGFVVNHTGDPSDTEQYSCLHATVRDDITRETFTLNSIETSSNCSNIRLWAAKENLTVSTAKCCETDGCNAQCPTIDPFEIARRSQTLSRTNISIFGYDFLEPGNMAGGRLFSDDTSVIETKLANDTYVIVILTVLTMFTLGMVAIYFCIFAGCKTATA